MGQSVNSIIGQGCCGSLVFYVWLSFQRQLFAECMRGIALVSQYWLILTESLIDCQANGKSSPLCIKETPHLVTVRGTKKCTNNLTVKAERRHAGENVGVGLLDVNFSSKTSTCKMLYHLKKWIDTWTWKLRLHFQVQCNAKTTRFFFSQFWVTWKWSKFNYAVARVFWVDARWLFTGLLQSFYDILVPGIFAHFYCYCYFKSCKSA